MGGMAVRWVAVRPGLLLHEAGRVEQELLAKDCVAGDDTVSRSQNGGYAAMSRRMMMQQ